MFEYRNSILVNSQNGFSDIRSPDGTSVLLELVKLLEAKGVSCGHGEDSEVTGFSKEIPANGNSGQGDSSYSNRINFVLTCKDSKVKWDVLTKILGETLEVPRKVKKTGGLEETYDFLYSFRDASRDSFRFGQGRGQHPMIQLPNRKKVTVTGIPVEVPDDVVKETFESTGKYGFGKVQSVIRVKYDRPPLQGLKTGEISIVYEGEGAIRPIPRVLAVCPGVRAFCFYPGQGKEICCRYCKSPEHKVGECPELKGKECFYCKEVGHFKRRCPKLKEVQKEREQNASATVREVIRSLDKDANPADWPALPIGKASAPLVAPNPPPSTDAENVEPNSGMALDPVGSEPSGSHDQPPFPLGKKERRRLKRQEKQAEAARKSDSNSDCSPQPSLEDADIENNSKVSGTKRFASSPIEPSEGHIKPRLDQSPVTSAEDTTFETVKSMTASFAPGNEVEEGEIADGSAGTPNSKN